uniref:Uncharacterized protein n=1 Tax=Branchiostoma floridae TaxID=7739 RepID=C3XUU2_BRAFL|eukprot:XP_002612158.1 hypothetical protein BRAFLDRAFT_88897 [Branchiostoma floridae]
MEAVCLQLTKRNGNVYRRAFSATARMPVHPQTLLMAAELFLTMESAEQSLGVEWLECCHLQVQLHFRQVSPHLSFLGEAVAVECQEALGQTLLQQSLIQLSASKGCSFPVQLAGMKMGIMLASLSLSSRAGFL